MNKKTLYALLLIAALVIIFIFNHGDVRIDLLVSTITPPKAIAFLAFTGIGVAIGLLLN